MKRIVAALILACPAAVAQTTSQWVDFPPAQSRLTFDAPGLTEKPTKAVESVLVGGASRKYRHFGYVFNNTLHAAGFAQVYVASISANQTYFTEHPKYDEIIPTFYLEFRGKPIDWRDNSAKAAQTPIGETKYRRFAALSRSCVAFGGLYGAGSSLPFSSGHLPSGSEQIYGYYCAPNGHELSETDVGIALSRLGYDGLGKPKGSRPAFGAPAPQPSVASPATASLQTRQVVVLWEGKTGAITGSVLLDPNSSTSKLEVRLPSENQTCLGISSLSPNGTGEWAVQCPNGTSASGKFRGLGGGQGSMGEGVDNTGAKVSFVMAGK